MEELILKGDNLDHYYSLIDEGKLPILNLWFGSLCNLNCIYCATDPSKGDSNEMTLDEAKRVIDEAKEMGAQTVGLNGKGEPQMDDNFFPLIRHIFKNNMTTRLSTNATMVTKSVAKFFYDHDVSPVVKLHSLIPEEHDYLVGKKRAFYQTFSGLNRMMEAGLNKTEIKDDGTYTRLAVMTLLAEPCYNSMPKLFQFCKRQFVS